ncbi:hypothetical protein DPMN_145139 [Dreissena polymorpha]|uniref:Uncharacterized protein n=1 Tax=Dreissena polymorpha TaxID=45954 RepID=A0A9D4F3E9_DREPO|nr:hypothetical protein DPMN_145139 [Dreissena polymorpha]
MGCRILEMTIVFVRIIFILLALCDVTALRHLGNLSATYNNFYNSPLQRHTDHC